MTNLCPSCQQPLDWKAGDYICQPCQQHFQKLAFCPSCDQQLEKLNACGAVDYFCNHCKALQSKSRVRIEFQSISN